MSFFATLPESFDVVDGGDCDTGCEATITAARLRPMSDSKLLLNQQFELLRPLLEPLGTIAFTESFRVFVSSNKLELHRLVR